MWQSRRFTSVLSPPPSSCVVRDTVKGLVVAESCCLVHSVPLQALLGCCLAVALMLPCCFLWAWHCRRQVMISFASPSPKMIEIWCWIVFDFHLIQDIEICMILELEESCLKLIWRSFWSSIDIDAGLRHPKIEDFETPGLHHSTLRCRHLWEPGPSYWSPPDQSLIHSNLIIRFTSSENCKNRILDCHPWSRDIPSHLV